MEAPNKPAVRRHLEMCQAIGIDGGMLTEAQLFQVQGVVLDDPIVEMLVSSNLKRLLNSNVYLPSGSRAAVIRELMDENDRAQLRDRIAQRVNLPAGAFR
jgi:hypothetical protein